MLQVFAPKLYREVCRGVQRIGEVDDVYCVGVNGSIDSDGFHGGRWQALSSQTEYLPPNLKPPIVAVVLENCRLTCLLVKASSVVWPAPRADGLNSIATSAVDPGFTDTCYNSVGMNNVTVDL